MALSLGVSRGSKIAIGPHQEHLTVMDIQGGTTIIAIFRGRSFEITDQDRVELMPGVFVSCGVSAHKGLLKNNRGGSRFSRLAFEAPRSIVINRVPAEALHA